MVYQHAMPRNIDLDIVQSSSIQHFDSRLCNFKSILLRGEGNDSVVVSESGGQTRSLKEEDCFFPRERGGSYYEWRIMFMYSYVHITSDIVTDESRLWKRLRSSGTALDAY